ncbi:CDP-archaeol synthase [Candidatus Shapirobacteria bacterium]|nr:CDP-archaeol synthase [Candidatus Shapirobacteria bacterium]
MIDWVKLFWIMLPAGIANMVPPMAVKIWPKWNIPIDMGKSWDGKRIFGDHKTIRGFVTGILAAEIIFLILKGVVIREANYPLPWYFGAAMGLGGLGGDAIKSFFKRRAGVASGVSWFPWDQIDWIVGVIPISTIWRLLSLKEMAVLLLAGMALHLLFKVLGYLLRLNNTII